MVLRFNSDMKKYWAVASLSLLSCLGVTTVAPQLNAQMVADGHSAMTIVDLCNALVEADSSVQSLQCLLDQSTHLNRAKNLARQRGERDNGGITTVETEPSMHGPSAESPHQLVLGDGSTQYIFTFRIRPRTTANYTHESQVRVTYTDEGSEWSIDTVYNNRIESTPVSYSEQLETEDS
ncbi:MAG: hypothetical protein F6K35_42210 [Okeania sp. SIO2H7]|nr:hypothetical protein [Okeania sp. SIO2H7]